MKRIAILALLAAFGVSQAAAEEPRRKAARPEAKKPNPCAAQGPGFTMLPGTTTCVRIGGAVEGDLAISRGSAPNLGVK